MSRLQTPASTFLRWAPKPPIPAAPEGLEYAPCTLPQYALHIFRHTLRAASYLPEPYLRASVKNKVCESFRRRRTKLRRATEPASHVDYHQRLKKYIVTARNELNVLRRAALGQKEPLEKVINDAYGRTGRPRRFLVANLLKEDEACIPPSDTTLETYIASFVEKPRSFEPSEKLQTLIASQQRSHPFYSRRKKIRNISPTLPETNLWGRPLPRKLADSKKARFWSDLFDRLLPPLPTHESSRLKAICNSSPDLLPRRARPMQSLAAEHKASAKTEAEERESLEYDPKNFRLSTRGWKKLWGSVLAQSPEMELSEDTKKWVVNWPPVAANAQAGKVTQPTVWDMELFIGFQPPVEAPKKKKVH
ncbi:hypothetical protein BP6252_08450 [Coleophoma cylindrospora]|uniref:LYR motif-containing protein Cup1-like N-terminal domain-containing protein n=1 Tax=Coleophoma cylindrospora TaxID=1849047 RepID=A0A3D8R655_9HELO|nr:hypothetical protein BP6252_08450 [Coleophoma cylindrospora]